MTTNSELNNGVTEHTTEDQTNGNISNFSSDANVKHIEDVSSITTTTAAIETATAAIEPSPPTTTTDVAADLLRTTETRSSYSMANGKDIARSWYARCNRWRSLSCERRKNRSMRYSWNMVGNQM